MSYVDERYSIELCPNRGMSVLQSGWQKCDPDHHNGPMRYRHYSITFVLHGCGLYTVNDHTYKVKRGEGFVIYPESIPYYIADSQDPWEYNFVVFQGADAPKLLQSAGITPENPVFRFPLDETMTSALKQLQNLSRSGSALGYDVVGQFFLCMARLVQLHASEKQEQAHQNRYVEKAMVYMETNYPYHISVTDVASYVGIERSYLYRLFLEAEGISPSSWLMKRRLSHAVNLLQENELTITEIAYSVGFYDVSHFSKAFKEVFQCSPKEYLNRYKKIPNFSSDHHKGL